MMNVLNVLSLFDGMSGAQIALNRANIPYNRYFASEIDKYAMAVAMHRYPDTIQLGDVKNIKAYDLPQIDLLIGGFPCQAFSFAGKQLNFDDPRGKLFFECVRLLKELNPRYFLFENVKMKKEYQDQISKLIGVEPIEINSNLVSAQNRKRLYWTNIPNVGQPEDKGILLEDIIENGAISLGLAQRGRYNNGKIEQRYEFNGTAKSNALTTVSKDSLVFCSVDKFRGQRQLIFQKPHGFNNGGFKALDGKTPTLSSNSWEQNNFLLCDKESYRKLTPLECERLQTIPDNYTKVEGISNSQRYKMVGNGFTVDVIAHILKNMSKKPIQKIAKQLEFAWN